MAELILHVCVCNNNGLDGDYSFFGSLCNAPDTTDIEVDITRLLKDGEDYEAKGKTWAGSSLGNEDFFYYLLNGIIRGYHDYDALYVCNELRGYVAFYKDNTICVDGEEFPVTIVDAELGSEKVLDLVTKKYVYYTSSDGEFLMLDRQGKIISDNNFAECGFMSSFDEIKAGSDDILWISDDAKEYYEEFLREEV